MVVPTLIGGILSANINNGHYLGLIATAAIPIDLADSLYPNFKSDGNISPAGWAAAYVVVVAISLAVLALRYRGDEG